MRLIIACVALTFAVITPAFADEFGSRFGSSSSYALQNTFDRAQSDTAGIGLDDLNDAAKLGAIAPAAGDEANAAQEKNADEAAVPEGAAQEAATPATETSPDAAAVTLEETEATPSTDSSDEAAPE